MERYLRYIDAAKKYKWYGPIYVKNKCVCVHIYIDIYIYTSILPYIYTNIYMFIYIYTHMYVCIYVSLVAQW